MPAGMRSLVRQLSRPEPGERRLSLALDSWRHWVVPLSGRPTVVGPTGAGLTNSSWLVESCSGQAVVRLNSPIGDRLGVNRHREARVLEVLADTGITPPVWHIDPDAGFLVTAFIAGREWQVDDLADSGQRRRLGELVDCYQRVETGLPARDYGAYLDHYWQRLQGLDVTVPPALASRYHRCRDELGDWLTSQPAVLTHHDLTPANIIDCQDRLYLLDWEYAAPGCGDIDRLVLGQADCPARVRELVAVIDELWFVVRATDSH